MQLLGSGTIFREVIAAAELLKQDWGVDADLGLPSMNELSRRQRRRALEPAHPAEKPKLSHVEQCLNDTRPGHRRHRLRPPLFRADPPFVNRRYVTLGTDGSVVRTREKLRHFFEVNRYWVTLAA